MSVTGRVVTCVLLSKIVLPYWVRGYLYPSAFSQHPEMQFVPDLFVALVEGTPSRRSLIPSKQISYGVWSELKGCLLERQGHDLVCRNYRTSDVNARNKAPTQILGFNSVLQCRLAVARITFSCINLSTFELQMTETIKHTLPLSWGHL